MKCTNPLRLKATDEREEMDVPCRKCLACQINRRHEWAYRITAECFDKPSCFVTLTLSDYEIDVNHRWLSKKDCQDFFKRLRKNTGAKFKYFLCGEYGERTNRPHYHACIMGWRPPDLVYYRASSRGSPMFTSLFLESVWKLGLCSVGDVTHASASYVAGYIQKNLGVYYDNAKHPDRVPSYWIHPKTGEVTKPFQLQSQGIGYAFAELDLRQISQTYNYRYKYKNSFMLPFHKYLIYKRLLKGDKVEIEKWRTARDVWLSKKRQTYEDTPFLRKNRHLSLISKSQIEKVIYYGEEENFE